jgi:TonB family protein
MDRSDAGRRIAAAAAVVLVHALIALTFYLSFPTRAPPPPGDALQLLTVELINRPPPTSQPDLDPQESPPPTRSPTTESPSAFIASGAGERAPSSEITDSVVDAYFDSRPLSLACARAYPDSAPDLGIPGSVTLLVRVEPSGRPSELKVVVSSGAPSLDEAASGCLMALGALRPTIVSGRAVSGWQRIVWRSIAGAR